jgi:hypothetical protein
LSRAHFTQIGADRVETRHSSVKRTAPPGIGAFIAAAAGINGWFGEGWAGERIVPGTFLGIGKRTMNDDDQPIVIGCCPACGAPMRVLRAHTRWFLGCSAYPKCRTARQLTPDEEADLKRFWKNAEDSDEIEEDDNGDID